ncbi:MAG: response regulator [Gracilibacteraceae bacterium]|jgi:putative two-component system response regulator|nr:response regulator [Gracilibacteraceae bacterium]
MRKILVVDDNQTNLRVINTQLADDYYVALAASGEQALRICATEKPDLILLDVFMPGMDGFETLRQIKTNAQLIGIPVIFLTGSNEIGVEVKGLSLGARDFLTKPVEKSVLIHRINLHLRFASYQTNLEKMVQELSDTIAVSFAEMIEYRDESTGGHVTRTGRLVGMLGAKLIEMGAFSEELTPEALEMMKRAAPLHDIGKIAISDRILLKPDRLDDGEFAVMKRHALLGAEILQNMYQRMPTQRCLHYASLIAASHHERYDGKGYPAGLAGGDIPLCGRIMAVADVYDALTDDRVYRKGMSRLEARNIILEGRGLNFDPLVVDAFAALSRELTGED